MFLLCFIRSPVITSLDPFPPELVLVVLVMWCRMIEHWLVLQGRNNTRRKSRALSEGLS